jgi:phage/plasmid-like protein (TIGR03299 family)
MAHELTLRANGFAEMAYVGAVPWHGLGQQLTEHATIEEWQIAAGLNWRIMRSPVNFFGTAEMHTWDKQEVLYRSDTLAPLHIVANGYNIVQPADVLEFFRDLVADQGYTIETAGTLKGGRRIWALARTNLDGEVVEGDTIRTYLLLVTSCDQKLCTIVRFTSVRVVCNNTLQMALYMDGDNAGQIKVRHSVEFDADAVKAGLGLNAKAVYDNFLTRMRSLAELSLSGDMAAEIIENLFEDEGVTGGVKGIRSSRGFKSVMDLFNGGGKGSLINGVAGTGWGLVNAVTEFTDFHAKAANNDNRLTNAWFGTGMQRKDKILDLVENF